MSPFNLTSIIRLLSFPPSRHNDREFETATATKKGSLRQTHRRPFQVVSSLSLASLLSSDYLKGLKKNGVEIKRRQAGKRIYVINLAVFPSSRATWPLGARKHKTTKSQKREKKGKKKEERKWLKERILLFPLPFIHIHNGVNTP